MSKKKAAELTIPLPEMGLSKKALAALSARFKNDIIEVLGGPERLAGRDIIINMIVAEPEPWREIAEGE